MKNVDCYICGKNDATTLFPGNMSDSDLRPEHIAARQGAINKEFMYNWVRCNTCGLVYVNPVPDKEKLERLYAESDQRAYTDEVDNLSKTYCKYLYRYGKHLTRRGTALDIGAGSGFFLKALKEFGFQNVTGLEPSVSACASAPDDLRGLIKNTSFDERDFVPGSMDFISCMQTLEHVFFPNQLIDSLARVLADNGLVYIVTHNFGAIGVKIFGARHPIVNAGHLALFDEKTLRKLLEKKFDVIDVFKISNRYSLKYWTSLFPMNPKLKSVLTKVLEKTRLASIPLTLSMGNIGIIARKSPKKEEAPQ